MKTSDSIYKRIRGGSWDNNQDYARASARSWDDVDYRYYENGFRLIEDPKSSPQTRKMIRGGCWSFDADASRSAYRLHWPRPADRNLYVGFRLLEDHPKS